MHLYELAEKYAELQRLAEEGDSEAIISTLQALEDAIEEKAENIAKWMRSLKVENEAIRAEEKRLEQRRRANEKLHDKLEKYLQEQMQKAGKQKIKLPTFTVYLQRNQPAVQVLDELEIPPVFWIYPQPRLDKATLAERLKAGEQIPGVCLTQETTLRIR
ncbi:MAG: siphovirus Gp157 family protein [Brevibacillus sp.]|nr:siphovirus Gp157 family protein [Brevibacillus sp.]